MITIYDAAVAEFLTAMKKRIGDRIEHYSEEQIAYMFHWQPNDEYNRPVFSLGNIDDMFVGYALAKGWIE